MESSEEDFDSLPVVELQGSEDSDDEDNSLRSSEIDGYEPKAGWSEAEKGPPEIDVSELQYDEEKDFLGEGTYGKVFKGRCRGQEVAIKVPVKQHLTKQELEEFRREVFMMSKIFHPNVVLFMGACTQEGNIRIVTELMQTDLETFLRKRGKEVDLYKRIKMAKDAALGLNWLHGICKCVHRDLKPANLLVDERDRVKVSDFGFAQQLKTDRMRDKAGPRGSALWMAPEVMKQQEFDASIDVYSFGIVLWEIYTTKEPFEEYSEWEPFYHAVCNKNERPPIDDDCPPSLKKLMEDCWSANPKVRPSFNEIIHRLDEVLVDIAIIDEKARQFWKEHFVKQTKGLKEEISWTDFVASWTKAAGIQRAQTELLQEFLVSQNKVTIQSFNQAVLWFGHFFVEGEAKKALEEADKLMKAPWFFKQLSAEKAEALLRKQPLGTFLVRLSTTRADCPFTISKVAKSRDKHLRVRRIVKPDGSVHYTVYSNVKNSKTYESITALIEGVANELELKYPCPNEEEFDNGYY